MRHVVCLYVFVLFLFTGNEEAAKATLDFNTKNTEQSETLGNLSNLVKIISYKLAERIQEPTQISNLIQCT